ncbi:uncharacterized protein LOC18430636 isoform X1 [Amborella trichopoda]|uniref:uncharacterized protein LOC18430636 isoform X1 n=1 Tax=Amborella trichopoda TaxID=13333 RepID=UPI0005D32A29|nr:uncharacterized protein LOC18430636 isoform X1 [Amborella trichopoda]|eukprot:XP_011622053.1 uncharacterized protein LOC18430636 isoform X1 [Amborella trichopoda]
MAMYHLSLFFCSTLIVVWLVSSVDSIAVPSSNCYVIDNSSYIYDFTEWIGFPFEYSQKDSDLVVRFCKDVESRSQMGYVDFGRYEPSLYFIASSGSGNFVQEFHSGDLTNCELHSFDKMGRTAQVNIFCGRCSDRETCKEKRGCVCSVSYDGTMCRVLVELAISCGHRGSRVFEGFTVGFHPRSWEVVYNGMTQMGFEKPYHEFSFGTDQTIVSLYLTAISTLSNLVGKPSFEVNPSKGLEVKLSGSGAKGSPPTTLSPTILNVNWRCDKANSSPYEVVFTIPIDGYEPIKFSLTKTCEYDQERGSDATRGWATFGVLSCVFIVLASIFCCAGFVYKIRVEHQRGLDALPGITVLSACLEAVTGSELGYSRADTLNGSFVNSTSWDSLPVTEQATQRTGERKYGSM